MDFSASQELVASTPEPRNWRANIISVLVIIFVILMVVCSVFLMTPPDPGPRVSGERIRLDDIIHGKFKPNPFNATWHSGSKLYYMNKDGGLSFFDVASNKVTEVLDNTTFRTLNYQSWSVSKDEKHVMIVHDSISVFRYSSLAKYTVVSLEQRFSPLIKIGRQKKDVKGVDSQEYLQHAEFVDTPTGGQGVIFVTENNIYHQPDLTDSLITQLTVSGEPGTIYNGVADWLYEEEILGQSHTVYPASDGSKLAYISFNDSGVERHEMQKYGGNSGSLKFRYPKAGTTNPTATIFVQTLSKQGNSEPVKVQPPQEVTDQDHYVLQVSWASDTELGVLYQNRLQNTSYYVLCSHPQYQCDKIHIERSEEGWVENRGLPIFNSDLSQMVLIEPVEVKGRGKFPHIVQGLVSGSNNIPLTTITHGPREVVKILAWDTTNDLIYYLSTLISEPGTRHLMTAGPGADQGSPTCLTCPKPQGNSSSCASNIHCQYNEIRVSPEHNAYVQFCLGPGVPSVHVYSLPDNKCLLTLDTNSHIHHQINVSSMPRTEEMEVTLPGSPVPARLSLTLPPVLRESEDYKFPLLVNIYGGPGTQTVSSKWSVGWDTYLASQRNFIVANIDVRGTGLQGEAFKHAVYGQLGKYEAADTLHVIRELVKEVKFIDKDRVCVWGWSYGGYVAGMVMAAASDLIACGIAVSPVTQWQNYDTAYTERYMGLPGHTDNWQGYMRSSLTAASHNVRDGALMVIHGTQDDNVHIEHTMSLSRELVENDIIFRQQIYPDESHGLFGVTRHLYETMEAFLDEIYGPIEDYFEDDYYLAAAKLLEEYGELEEHFGAR